MGIYSWVLRLHRHLPQLADNMSTAQRKTILLHLTIAILILAIWTGTTSAVNKQKCLYGGNVKCVDVMYNGHLVKKELCIQTILGRYWCASSVKSDGTYLHWDYNCRTCEQRLKKTNRI